jgi:hypothetical protein
MANAGGHPNCDDAFAVAEVPQAGQGQLVGLGVAGSSSLVH